MLLFYTLIISFFYFKNSFQNLLTSSIFSPIIPVHKRWNLEFRF